MTKTNEEIVEEFVENGAHIEHERWSKWQAHFFKCCNVANDDGVIVNLHLPKNLYERWLRQIATPYAELSEPEKESDRREVRSYIPLLQQALTLKDTQHEEEMREMLVSLLNSLPLRSDWDDDVKVTFQMGVDCMRQNIQERLDVLLTPKTPEV